MTSDFFYLSFCPLRTISNGGEEVWKLTDITWEEYRAKLGHTLHLQVAAAVIPSLWLLIDEEVYQLPGAQGHLWHLDSLSLPSQGFLGTWIIDQPEQGWWKGKSTVHSLLMPGVRPRLGDSRLRVATTAKQRLTYLRKHHTFSGQTMSVSGVCEMVCRGSSSTHTDSSPVAKEVNQPNP